jgi:hypothetical protein
MPASVRRVKRTTNGSGAPSANSNPNHRWFPPAADLR